MTYDELLARINDLPEVIGLSEFKIRHDALRAVVQLHQPIWTFLADSDKSIPLCVQCRDGDSIADYPCGTIQAIEEALVQNVDN